MQIGATKKPLTVKRAADRKQMFEETKKLVTSLGCTWTLKEYPGPRELALDITAPGGLALGVSFDGNSCQPDTFVMSWHMELDSTAKLSNATFGGDVNPYHKQKATYVAYSYEHFVTLLTKGLKLAVSGDAYLKE